MPKIDRRLCALLLICLSFVCVCLCAATNEQYLWSTHNKARHLTCKTHSSFCSHFAYWDVSNADTMCVQYAVFSHLSLIRKQRSMPFNRTQMKFVFVLATKDMHQNIRRNIYREWKETVLFLFQFKNMTSWVVVILFFSHIRQCLFLNLNTTRPHRIFIIDKMSDAIEQLHSIFIRISRKLDRVSVRRWNKQIWKTYNFERSTCHILYFPIKFYRLLLM